MVKLLPQCLIVGPAFSPSNVIWLKHTELRDINEPGDIGTKGRYKGLPLPYGSCTIIITEKPGDWNLLDNLLIVLEAHIDKIRQQGGTEIILYCNVFHDGQCNFEFTGEELEKISKMNISLAISCYTA